MGERTGRGRRCWSSLRSSAGVAELCRRLDRLTATPGLRGVWLTGDRAVAVETEGNEVVVLIAGGQRASGHRLLVATGRHPRPRDLHLDAVGV